MRASSAIACVAAALLFGLAGCGDDDDDGAGGASTEAGISKAEFIERADELCTGYRERILELQRQIDRTSDSSRQADLVREVAGEAESILDDFDELGTPAGDEDLLGNYKSTGREQIALIRRTADALERGETGEARRLIDSGRQTGSRLREIAQGYGFKVCGAGEG